MTPCACVRLLWWLPGRLQGWAFERFMDKVNRDMETFWPPLAPEVVTTPE